MEDEIGTPPTGDGFLSGTVSPSYHHAARMSSAWGTRTLQPNPSFKGIQPNRKNVGSFERNLHNGEAAAVDLISLLEENWFWRSSTASPSMVGTTSGPRLEAPRTPTPRRQHRMAGASPMRERGGDGSEASLARDADPAAPPEANGFHHRESSESEVDSAAGSSFTSAGPDLSRRKTRSANLDDVLPQQRGGGEARPHSYAHGRHLPRDNGDARPEINTDAIETIGTWGHRVIRFPAAKPQPSHPTHIPGTPEERKQTRARLGGRGREPLGDKGDGGSEDEAAAVNAAWKWRFNRRWRTEQAKQLDPDFGMEGDDEDGWDDALGYLDACGPGVQHQIARTTSMEQTLAGASSMASNASDMSQMLVDESQKDKGVLQAQAEMDATKKVRSVAKKAQNLYLKQKEIEKDVKTRWGNTLLSMSWAGQHMKVVEIDSYGRFPFVLVRVSDRTKVQRLLVRGRNNATKDDLMKDVKRQAENVCHDFNLPPITISLVGSGTLSWSQERDHRINVSSGHVEKVPDSNICTGEDVCRVAGNLTRASLPAPGRVTIEGRKLS